MKSIKIYIFPFGKYKNVGNRSSPRTRFSRNVSDVTCTNRQVGCRSWPLLLPTSTDRHSVGGRPANRAGSPASLYKNVGPKGHATHQAGNKILCHCEPVRTLAWQSPEIIRPLPLRKENP